VPMASREEATVLPGSTGTTSSSSATGKLEAGNNIAKNERYYCPDFFVASYYFIVHII